MDLESRTRDEEAAEAEVLDKSGCPRGSMTVLMTEEREMSLTWKYEELKWFLLYKGSRFTFKLPLNSHEFLQNRCDFLK